MSDQNTEITGLFFLALLVLLMVFCLRSPIPERFFWESLSELTLDSDCERLRACLANAGTYRMERDYETNRCIITKIKHGHPDGDYIRQFRIPELRGALRTCEMLTNTENLQKF